MIRASVLGATGYAGIELVRLLCSHPKVRIAHIASHSYAGRPLSEIYPNFAGSGLLLEDINIDKFLSDSDVIFTSLPHGTSGEVIPRLIDKGVKVIDLSGDFRYDDAEVYRRWYNMPHDCPQLLGEFVYGLPELYRQHIKEAEYIANPGCYPTCSILAAAPLLKAGLIDPASIVIDAKSGASGAGRAPGETFYFCEAHENFKAYKVAGHRHTSEIEQELSKVHGKPLTVSFTPHLLPVKRGILSTVYAAPVPNVKAEDIKRAFEEAYGDEAFVTLYENGKLPELKHVIGSNRCAVGFVLDERAGRLIIISALDNLIKGAGGQAIQNLNLMFGIDEAAGLNCPAWYL